MANDKNFVVNFSFFINKIRVEKGLTIEQLADLASVHRTTIGLIERNERSPTISVAKRIADALEVELSKLVELAEKKG